jgi:sulfopyruvate decarboxylase subunit beta
MKRIDCLKAIAGKVGDALVVASAGGATVEWYDLHPSDGNFRSRTLGLASSIGLGIALSLPHRKVIVLDGDGSLLMNLCGLSTAAWSAPRNLIHIVFDNSVYESSGSSPTATSGPTDLVAVAKAAGFPRAIWASDVAGFVRAVSEALAGQELTFIGVKVEHGIVPGIASPTTDDTENKYRFMRHIEKLEGRKIFGSGYPEL